MILAIFLGKSTIPCSQALLSEPMWGQNLAVSGHVSTTNAHRELSNGNESSNGLVDQREQSETYSVCFDGAKFIKTRHQLITTELPSKPSTDRSRTQTTEGYTWGKSIGKSPTGLRSLTVDLLQRHRIQEIHVCTSLRSLQLVPNAKISKRWTSLSGIASNRQSIGVPHE